MKLLSTDEIAALWQCSNSTVSLRMKKARIQGQHVTAGKGVRCVYEPRQIERALRMATKGNEFRKKVS